jgi:hypothetical protein
MKFEAANHVEPSKFRKVTGFIRATRMQGHDFGIDMLL